MDIISQARQDKDDESAAAFRPLVAVDAHATLDDTYALARLKALGLTDDEAVQLTKG